MGGVTESDTAASPPKGARARTRSGELLVAFEDDALRVTVSGDPQQPGVFLCFTGVGGGVGGVQMEEFVGSTRLPGYFAVYITDKKRSWYNWDVAPVLDILRPYVEGKSVVTIGNSMGGFGAIWMAGALGNVHTCMAFAAQYSVHPEIMPEEQRWLNYREAITDWRMPSLMNSFEPTTRFWTFNGGRDAEHWSKFPLGENRSHFLTRDAGHDVARTLKEAGVLSDVIERCIEGEDPMDLIAAGGVQIERITPQLNAMVKKRLGARQQGRTVDLLGSDGPGRNARQKRLAAAGDVAGAGERQRKRRKQT